MSALDWLATRAATAPEAIGLIAYDAPDTGDSTTYRVWNARVERLAAHLAARHGVGRGDRIAVLAKNHSGYLDLLFASNKLGAVLQTLNMRLSAAELGALLAASEAPRVLVTDETCADLGRESLDIRSEYPHISGTIPLIDLRDLLEDARHETTACPPFPELSPEDPWVICYTGGSTGTPKGALIPYRQAWANAVQTATSWSLGRDARALVAAPLFHVGGLFVYTTAMVACGGATVLVRGFEAAQVLALIGSGTVTHLFGVPTMFHDLAENPAFATTDFGNLRRIVSGGAPCPEPLYARYAARGLLLRNGYGLTEAGPNTFDMAAEEVPLPHRRGAVGFPLFGIRTRISRDDGSEAPRGEPGELWIGGMHLFGGYDGRPAETEAAFCTDSFGTRWLKTGDLAICEPDGCHRIVGRKKEIYISGGENIFPLEIETILLAHPAIAEAAVVAVADEKWGEVGAAFVAGRPELAALGDLAAALTEYCRAHLARYKVPKQFHVLSTLPRTGAGKIDKPALRRLVTGAPPA